MSETFLRTEGGEAIRVDEWKGDTPETLSAVAAAGVVLDDLEPEEAEVDPASFAEEVADYLKDILRLKKPPEVRFEVSGLIGRVAYWVFSSNPPGEGTLYAMMVRNECVSELVCVPADMESGERMIRLSPAQAALWDYCVTEYRRPTC